MTNYRTEIEDAAAAYGLDPDLVAAIVEQESSGRFHAYRYEPNFYAKYLAGKQEYEGREPREISASFGLMQVMYTTAREHGFVGEPWELFNPRVSLDYGCQHLASLLKWARSHYTGLGSNEKAVTTRSALAAYNGGKSKNGPQNVPLRNAMYADQVLVRYRRIKGEVDV
jgi:soluble lytic murein transglycosylase-like protein